MRADRERMRAEALRSSRLFGAKFGMQVFGPISAILLGLYVWLSRGWMAVIGGIALVVTVFNLISWLDGRRARSGEPPKTTPARQERPRDRYEDSQLGTLWSGTDGWCVDVVVDGEDVTVELEISREPGEAGPSAEARALWNDIRAHLDERWREIVDFTLAWANGEADAGFTPEEFALRSIHIAPNELFEGGEVVYWFEVATDFNGCYFVPVHDGKPLFVHRDS